MEQVFESEWFIGIVCSLIAGAILGLVAYLRKRKKDVSSATSTVKIGRKNMIKGGINVNTSTNRENDR